jgi:hypothetical protein
MKRSRLLAYTANPLLFLLEYIFKFTAGVLAVIVLGSQGSFFGKLGAGFGSLVDVIYQIMAWPDKLGYIGTVINDYNTLTAASFNQRYGGEAVNQVMTSLNEGVAYFQAVYQNLINQPVATIFAVLIAFCFFYFCGRACRFIRQRGRGSYLTRKEREFGERVFGSRNGLYND